MRYILASIMVLSSVLADVPASKQQINLSFAPIVKKVEPAVVSIYTAQVIERPINPLFDDEFFNQFFDIPQVPRQELAKSMGSGVLIDDKGTIVTCAHVVRNAKEIKVKLSDSSLQVVQVKHSNLFLIPNNF